MSHNPVIRVNHTGMSVSDLEQSLAFYVGVLGLEKVFQSHVSARRDIDACVGLSDVDADIVFLDAGDTRVGVAVRESAGASAGRHPPPQISGSRTWRLRSMMSIRCTTVRSRRDTWGSPSPSTSASTSPATSRAPMVKSWSCSRTRARAARTCGTSRRLVDVLHMGTRPKPDPPMGEIDGVDVSTVGLGCNNFGMTMDFDQTVAVVDAALDAGINLFDTADVYGGTKSEEFLGRALQGRRDDAVVVTKFGVRFGELAGGASPN